MLNVRYARLLINDYGMFVRSQAYPKYPKQQIYNIFAIS